MPASALMSEARHKGAATQMACLRAAIRANKRAIAALAKSGSAAASSRVHRPKRESFLDRAALVVWVMTADERLALNFLREWPQNQHAAAPQRAEELRQAMSTMTASAKESLLKPASKTGERAISAATKYLSENSLFQWTHEQNSEKGLAPSYGALWRRYSLELRRQPSMLEEEPAAPPARAKHQRQRMRRWSRRWMVLQGRFQAGLRLPLETLRQKANGERKCDQKTHIPRTIGGENGQFCVPSFVSRFRPPFLGTPIMRTLTGGAVFWPRNRGHF